MLSRLEEIKLIALCAAADNRRAFERLVLEYQDDLRRFLYTLTMCNASLTDDLAQETFLKAYSFIRSFSGLSRFKTWLFRIAYNEYIGWMRRNHQFEEEAEIPVMESDDNSHRASEARHDVEVALRSLNPTERTVVVLFYIEDRKIKDIAKITGLPEGTIKVYLSRAKTKMACYISEIQ